MMQLCIIVFAMDVVMGLVEMWLDGMRALQDGGTVREPYI